MAADASSYASQLRLELCLRNRRYARGRAHVESYGNPPVIVYAPENELHGNFFDPAYKAILARPEWMRRFDKVHAQAARSLPKPQLDPARRWRELDSSTSSDALLMNVFCTPGVAESTTVRNGLGIEGDAEPLFGWKARVPLVAGRFDRTEVDMRLGTLLVEAKLTEGGFQTREAAIVESYRDFDTVFDRELLPRVELISARRKDPVEFPEAYSQEFESVIDATVPSATLSELQAQSPSVLAAEAFNSNRASECGYASYQLVRNVLAAFAADCSFCVLHDERRPDLREEWFQVMAAVKSAAMRVRLKILTWQELAALLPDELQRFLDLKYGIVAPGKTPSPAEEVTDFD
jgi:Restriction Endonuclease associating with ARP